MSASASSSAREADAARILGELGLSAVTVSAAGPEGEVAVVRASHAEWTRLFEADAMRAVEQVKATGFRYVALDLGPAPAGV